MIICLFHGVENVVQILIIGYTRAGTLVPRENSLMQRGSQRGCEYKSSSERGAWRKRHHPGVCCEDCDSDERLSHSFSLPFLRPGKVLMFCWCLGDVSDNIPSVLPKKPKKRFPLIAVHVDLLCVVWLGMKSSGMTNVKLSARIRLVSAGSLCSQRRRTGSSGAWFKAGDYPRRYEFAWEWIRLTMDRVSIKTDSHGTFCLVVVESCMSIMIEI